MNTTTTLKTAILAAAIAASLPASASVSAISAMPDLTGKNDADGVVLWFNSALKPTVPAGRAVTICVTQQVITFQHGSETETIEVPDARITIKPWETQMRTTGYANSWETSIPSSQIGRLAFMSGESFPMPDGLPRDTRNMTWTARFESDTPGVSVQWQWGAASYTQFSDSNNALEVASGDRFNPTAAGTPVAFKSFVVGDETDGSRYTGTRSAPTRANAEVTGRCGGLF